MLTSTEFEMLLNRHQLVVRAEVERAIRPGIDDQFRTLIEFWSWVTHAHSVYLVQIGYIWSEPDGTQAHDALYIHIYERNKGIAIDQIITLLREWPALNRDLWCQNEPAIATRITTRGKELQIPPCHPFLMAHYGRLHVLLGQRRDSKSDDSIYLQTCNLRLAGFIRAQANKWREVGLEF